MGSIDNIRPVRIKVPKPDFSTLDWSSIGPCPYRQLGVIFSGVIIINIQALTLTAAHLSDLMKGLV